MEIELIGNREQAERILQLLQSWDASLQTMDADALVAGYSETVDIFDIGGQFSGKTEYRAQWQACFPYFGDSMQIERRRTRIFAADDLAFIEGYTRVSGSNTPAPVEQPWSRITVCLRRDGDDWQVVYEHISMPIDFGAGKPALIFGEP